MMESGIPSMASFDPEKFDDKYVHYFEELQRAYKNAFNTMNDQYDSGLIHAIDQQILNESEPFYDESNGFRIELPENPKDRLKTRVVDDETFEAVLDEYVSQLKTELRSVFGVK